MAQKQRKTRIIAEYGDFQTPYDLALSVMSLLSRMGITPGAILEPTCGRGAFLAAAAVAFPNVRTLVGVEINPEHIENARMALRSAVQHVILQNADFFSHDWQGLLGSHKGPWLIVGNPPWVTSAELSSLNSANLPEKSNFQGHRGIEAVTGRSNFDISEWMLLRYLEWLSDKDGTIAVLCKTAVARKILLHVWRKRIGIRSARMFAIDAALHFSAAVEACLFVVELDRKAHVSHCEIFASIDAAASEKQLGFIDGHLVTDVLAFERHREILGIDPSYIWRSGVKHDCSRVFELEDGPSGLRDNSGNQVSIEPLFAYPLLKSSDVANGRIICRRKMLVTQSFVGEDTSRIQKEAPLTWDYLCQHAEALDRRASVIYKGKPRFSIFGVGPYTFSPWKVAISGLYKRLSFVKVGPHEGRPVVFDDTVYFLPCGSEGEAEFLLELLNSRISTELLLGMIHWDDKRPVTADLLKRVSIEKLASRLGRSSSYRQFAHDCSQSFRHASRNAIAHESSGRLF